MQRSIRRFSSSVPSHVETIVIGGGVIGACSSFHLAKAGSQVLVLEQNTLTSGTTWHAAGLVGTLKGGSATSEMVMKSIEVYKDMPNVGWYNSGSLTLVRDEDAFHAQVKNKQISDFLGNVANILTPSECKEVHPFLNLDGIICGVHMPHDGIINPADVTQEMVRRARALGVTFKENCRVLDIKTEGRKILGVSTSDGDITCDRLLVACGQWTPQICALAGEVVPQAIAPHQYICFEAMEGVHNHLPVVRDLLGRIYVKPEVGGFMVGVFEGDSQKFLPEGVRERNQKGHIPHSAEFELFEDDYDKSGIGLEAALELIPELQNTGIKQWLHGPDSHAIDHGAIMGRFPNKDNLYVASGFNSQGIQSGYGAGMAMKEWMLDGLPHSFHSDFWECDVGRFDPAFGKDKAYSEARACEGYSMFYAVHYPTEPWHSARNFKFSPVHNELLNGGAMMGDGFGYERPAWFSRESDSKSKESEFSFDQRRVSWWNSVREECLDCRERCAVFDMSPFSKVKVKGKDALKFLQWVCSSDIKKPVGSITYGLMCNEKGGVIADQTVYRISEDEFYVVIPSTLRFAIFGHMQNESQRFDEVKLEDVTDSIGVLAVMGPQSREILQSLTSTSLENESFPFGTGKEIEIGGHVVQALRVSFAGELGWELHFPQNVGGNLLGQVVDKGARNAGMLALLNSLRVEKQFPHFGHEISPQFTALDSSLGFACKLKTEINFLGRDALLEQQKAGVKTKTVSVSIPDSGPEISLWGHEVVYRDDEVVGFLTSGGYSHTLDRPIGLASISATDRPKITKKWIESGNFSVGVSDFDNLGIRRIPVEVSLSALVDPKMKRVHGTDGSIIV